MMSSIPNQFTKPTAFLRNIFSNLNNNDSSDDEVSQRYSQNYMNNDENVALQSNRGILVYSVYCVKTDRTKTFHIYLYTGNVFQYLEKKRKFFNVHDIQSISLANKDCTVSIDIKKAADVTVRQKKYIFESQNKGVEFKQVIEFRKEYGDIIVAAFNFIDRKKTRIITKNSLILGLGALDIRVEDDLVEKMLSLNNGDGSTCDFHSFYHLFVDSQISSIRECFLEWIQMTIINSNSKQLYNIGSLSSGEFEPIAGEIVANSKERVRWKFLSNKYQGNIPSFSGILYITNYRIVFVTSSTSSKFIQHENETKNQSRFDIPPYFNMISIPLCNIYRLSISQSKTGINISTKDYREILLIFSSNDSLLSSYVDGVIQMIESMAFSRASASGPASTELDLHPTHLFAFKYKYRYQSNGWSTSDIRKEYYRMGLLDESRWQLVDNSDWSLIETYPSYIILPCIMTPNDIKLAISHRSKGRLPAVTYRHAATGAVMCRSSQPLVGLTMKTSESDVKLLDIYRLKGIPYNPMDLELPNKFYIFDARGQIAATFNMAAGKGTEDVSNYKYTDLIYCDIENIHVMRSSIALYSEAMSPGAFNASPKPSHRQVSLSNGISIMTSVSADSSSVSSGSSSSVVDIYGNGADYYRILESSGWLKHIRLILKSSMMIAEKMHLEGSSVLVHCSDGWDRTSQLCSVAQILLDPHYRTIQGFAALIEKEWCSFGHKFHERCAHGENSSYLPNERSPVFLQFLDCVHQIVHQCSKVFEFNSYLLCFIADHLNSGLFGNFLGNSDIDRTLNLNVQELTKSIWSHVFDFIDRFRNPNYCSYDRPIWISCSISNMVVWHRYYSRNDQEIHPNILNNEEEWHDDWGRGFETALKQSQEKTSYRFVGAVREDPRRMESI